MNPVLQSIVEAAVDACGATQGWLLAVHGAELGVAAAYGGDAVRMIGAAVPAGEGTAGLVIASGQPMAIAVRPDDQRAGEGIAARLGLAPASVLCVPCDGDETVVGALEVVDKIGGGPFSFDDVELATLLAGIAGTALEVGGEADVAVRSPAEVAGELERLAAADPSGYRRMVAVMEALLARG